MRRVVVFALLSVAGCTAPTVAQKQDAINAALASAYVACKVALSDPRMEWEPGAREYCARVANLESTCESQ